VIILGAGIAGLTAAYELSRANYTVQIIEVTERPGGRNHSARQGTVLVEKQESGNTLKQVCKFDEGLYLNLGPGRLPYHHRRVLHYCDELGVKLEIYVMETMAKDESPHVAATVVNALVSCPQKYAVEMIRGYLDSSDPAVLSGAANGAGQRHDYAALPGLLAAYDRLQSPVDTEVMVDILHAFGAILTAKPDDDPVGTLSAEDSTRTMAVLEKARHDSDLNVAKAAAGALTQITGQTVDAATQVKHEVPKEFDVDLALKLADAKKKPTATLVTNRGAIKIALYGQEAPGTVANFVALARRGYYNGLSFHRVVADFVIQGGDPRGDGWGGPGYAIRCEYNPLRYKEGMVGMALSGKDTGGSQFFITHSPQPHLNGKYTIFGEVLSGMDVVDKIQMGDLIQEVRVDGI